MNPYDDNLLLGSYLAAFSTVGDVPTSLSGYGYGQQRHSQALGEFGIAAPSGRLPAQPAATAAVTATTVKTTSLQNMLNALQVYVTKTGFYDVETDAAWSRYAKLFKEPHSKIAPRIVDKVVDNKNVWISQQALGRLRDKALKTGRLRDEAARPIGSKPKAPAPVAPKPGVAPGSLRVPVDELQKILIALGQDPARITDGKYGPTTKAKYQAVAAARKLNTTIRGTTGGRAATVSAATYKTLKAAAVGEAAPPTRPEDKRVVVDTHDVQSILKRLGHPPERLSDGKTGPTTEGAWKESANKRGLDPYIVKATADLRNVRVSEKTFLLLKADADAKVSPDAAPKPPVLVALPSEQVATVTGGEMVSLLGLLGVPKPTSGEQVLAAWKAQAQKHKLDPRIEAAADKLVVLRATWDRLQELAVPKAPPPGPKRDLLAEAVAKIAQQSTSSVKTSTLRQAFNAAILEKRISREPFAPTGPWKGEMRTLLLRWMGVQEDTPGWDAWAAALVKGRLVSNDEMSVKLPPQVAQSLKDAAQKLAAARAAEAARIKDFTAVNPAEIIASINALGISTKKFDPSGGPKELADAIKTFFENTSTKTPAGDLVRLASGDTEIYVRTSVLVALNTQAQLVKKRAQATKSFRASMVANALKESVVTISVKTFQESIRHTVLSAQAGRGKKLTAQEKAVYSAVKVSGSFDKPTRAAYTLVARTAVFGAAVQQLQDLMRQQLGPRFKTERVREASNQAWNQYLETAVSNSNIKTLPALAQPIERFAELYRQNVAADVRRAESAAEQQKVLKTAVAKSTYIVAILDVQEALLEMAKPGRTVVQKQVKPTGVKQTGFADKPTRDGLLQLAALIFPVDYDLPETMWMSYLRETGVLVEQGRTKKGWRGASYIALPQALADLVSKNAGQWEATHGRAPTAANVAPLPMRDQALLLRFKKPTLVTATAVKKREAIDLKPGAPAPAPTPAPPPMPRAVPTPAPAPPPPKPAEVQKVEAVAQQKTREAIEKTNVATQKEAEAQRAEIQAQQEPQDVRLRQTADQKREEAAATAREAQQAAGEAQAAQDVAVKVAGPTIHITVPPVPTAPTPPPIQKAGMGVGPWFLGAAALAAVLWPKGDKEDETR